MIYPENESLIYGDNWTGTYFSIDGYANGREVEVDKFFVNDTENFQINNSGFLNWTGRLSVDDYYINVTVRDEYRRYNSTIFNINFSKATPVAYLNFSREILEFNFDELPTYIDVIENNIGSSDVEFNLWENNNLIEFPRTVYVSGNYNYKINTTGGENYTSLDNIDTNNLIIHKLNTSLSLYFDKESPVDYLINITPYCEVDLYSNLTKESVNSSKFCDFNITSNRVSLIDEISISAIGNPVLSKKSFSSNSGYYDDTNEILDVSPGEKLDITIKINSEYSNLFLSYGHNIFNESFIEFFNLTQTYDNSEYSFEWITPYKPGNYIFSFWITNESFNKPCGTHNFGERIDFTIHIFPEFNDINLTLNQERDIVNNQSITLPGGENELLCELPESQNYNYINHTDYFSVNKISPVLNISGNNSLIFGEVSDIFGFSCPEQLNCSLYRNDELVDNPDETILSVGDYNYSYNTSGNENYTSDEIKFNLSILNYQGNVSTYINGSRSNVTLEYNDSVYLNATLNEGEFDSELGSLNLSINETEIMFSDTENISILYTFDFSLGKYEVMTNYSGSENYTSDSESWFVTIVDTTSPWFTEIPEDDEIIYLENWMGVDFNISDNYEFDSFSINDTDNFAINNSGYLTWSEQLAVGNYYVNISINDTSGNYNWTIYNLNISKKEPSVATYLNGSRNNITLEYNDSIYLNSTLYEGEFDSEFGSLNLTLDTIQLNYSKSSNLSYLYTFDLPLGNYEIRTYYSGSENYTSGYESWNVSVVDTMPPWFTDLPDDVELVYLEEWSGVDFNVSDNYEFDSFLINDTDNFVINESGYLTWSDQLAVGDYYINVTTNDTSGNFNWTIYNLNITKATPSASLVNSRLWNFTYDGNPSNISISEDNVGANDLEFILWKDGLDVGINDSEASFGVYEYLINTTGGENYSSVSVLDFNTLNISKRESLVATYLNGSRSNIILEYNDSIYLNSTLNEGEFDSELGSLNLTLDGTQLNYSNSNNISYFYTFDLVLDDYNVRTYYSGSENYTVGYEAWNVSVVDTTLPWFTDVPEDDEIVYGDSWFGVNFNATDNYEFDNFSINDTENFLINSSGYLIWSDQLSAGNYYVNVSINDTSGNHNWTVYNLNITKSQSEVATYLNNSRSDITIEYNDSIYLNGSLIKGNFGSLTLQIDGNHLNSSASKNISSYYSFNRRTISNFELGNYTIKTNYGGTENYTSDSESWEVNVIDTTSPLFSNTPNDDEVIYGDSWSGVDFNVTDNYELDDFWINDTEHFEINNSGYLIWYDQLSAGNYYVNVSINDTSGNYNWTIYNLNISKAPTKVNLTVDGSSDDQSIVFDSNSLIEGELIVGECDKINLFINDTFVKESLSGTLDEFVSHLTPEYFSELGDYELKLVCPESENYFSSNDSLILTLYDDEDPIFVDFINEKNVDYGYEWQGINFNATDNHKLDSYFINDTEHFEINNSGYLNWTKQLSAGIYYVNISANDTSNNIVSSEFILNISKRIPSSNLLNNGSWRFPYNGSTVEISFNYSLEGGDDVEINLWKNGSLIEEVSDLQKDAGLFYYTINTTGGENYTSVNVLDERTLNISKVESNIISLINSSHENLTAEYNSTFLIKGGLINGSDGILNLTINGKEFNSSFFNSTSPLNISYNHTFKKLGENVVNVSFINSTNYLPSFSSLLVDIIWSKKPIVRINNLINYTTYSNQNLFLNATIIEDTISSIWYTINGIGSTLDRNDLSDRNILTSNLTFNEGFNNFTLFVRDDEERISNDSVSFLVDSTPPKVDRIYSKKPLIYDQNNKYWFNLTLYDQHNDIDSVKIYIKKQLNSSNNSFYNISNSSFTSFNLNFSNNFSDSVLNFEVWTFNFTNLSIDNYSYYFWANDSLGNSGNLTSLSSFRVVNDSFLSNSHQKLINESSFYESNSEVKTFFIDNLDSLESLSLSSNLNDVTLDLNNVILDNSLYFNKNTSFKREFDLNNSVEVNFFSNTKMSLSKNRNSNFELFNGVDYVFPSNYEGDLDLIFNIGLNESISFSRPVMLNLSYSNGFNKIGWLDNSDGLPVEIKDTCVFENDSSLYPTNFSLYENNICIDERKDNSLKLWTKHFSTFMFGDWNEIIDEPDDSDSENSGGGSTGSEGIVPPEEDSGNLLYDLYAERSNFIDLSNESDFLEFIRINTNVDFSDIGLKFEKSREVFEDILEYDEYTYLYFDLEMDDLKDEDINELILRFNVNKSWIDFITYSNFDVVLLQYDGSSWYELNTSLVKKNEQSYLFESSTDLFGTYVVSVKRTFDGVFNRPDPYDKDEFNNDSFDDLDDNLDNNSNSKNETVIINEGDKFEWLVFLLEDYGDIIIWSLVVIFSLISIKMLFGHMKKNTF
ncbi:MAG: PGF-pre-PGF domain-containing protein [bacterium]